MKKISSQSLMGLLIIIAGTMLLFENLGVPGLDNVLSTWWPSFLILIAIASIINNKRLNFSQVALLVIGLTLQLGRLDVIGVSLWQLAWPILLITIGLSLITNRVHKVSKSKDEQQNISVFLGGSSQKNNSANFKGGKISAILGGVELDISKAKIEKEAVINITTFCGGVEIKVPKNTIVKDQVNSFLGGVENKAEVTDSDNASILKITGDIFLGGLDIKD